MVSDAAERQRQRVARGEQSGARRVAMVVDARSARLFQGEKGWALRGRWVNDQLFPPAGAVELADTEADRLREEEEEAAGALTGEDDDDEAKDEGPGGREQEAALPDDETGRRKRSREADRTLTLTDSAPLDPPYIHACILTETAPLDPDRRRSPSQEAPGAPRALPP